MPNRHQPSQPSPHVGPVVPEQAKSIGERLVCGKGSSHLKVQNLTLHTESNGGGGFLFLHRLDKVQATLRRKGIYRGKKIRV